MLVGRQEELAALHQRLAENRPVVVLGEAGVGKTTLLRAAVAAAGRTSLEGGGLSTLRWMPYLLIERAIGSKLSGDSASIAAEVERNVGSGVLLADDLHWADAASLDVLVLLAGRVGVVAAVRSGDPGTDGALAKLREANVEVIELSPLDERAASELMTELRPDLSATMTARVYRRTGGNPFLLTELVATEDPSESLRLAVASRLRQLDPAQYEALVMLALSGRPLSSEHLGEGGQALVDAGLAELTAGTLSLRHALYGEVIDERVGDEERKRAHMKLARATTSDAEAAHHHAAAGEDELASTKAISAADATDWPHERATLLALAAEIEGPPPSDLRFAAADALHSSGRSERALEVLGDPETYPADQQAHAYLVVAQASWNMGDAEGSRIATAAGIERASAGTPDAIALRVEDSSQAMYSGDLETAMTQAEETLRLADEHGVSRAYARGHLGIVHLVGGTGEAEPHLAAAVDLARDEGSANIEIRASNNRVVALQATGRWEEAEAAHGQLIERARELRLANLERQLMGASLMYMLPTGAFDQLVERADELLRFPMIPLSRCEVVGYSACALMLRGRVDDALAQLDDVIKIAPAQYEGLGRVLYVKAWTLVCSGRPSDARQVVREAHALGDLNWVGPQIAWVDAWARFDLGEDPGAVPDGTPAPTGSQASEIGGLSILATGGDAREAAKIFDQIASQEPDVSHRARLRWLTGEALRRSGDDGAALENLRAAEVECERFGIEPWLLRARRSLRMLGERRSARRGRAGVLTAREKEVLDLVGAGQTNEEIARRLGLSVSTVRRQISTASTKLGATSRHQAAAMAADLQI